MKKSLLLFLMCIYSLNIYCIGDPLPNSLIPLKTICLIEASCFTVGFIATYFFKDKIMNFVKHEADKEKYVMLIEYSKNDLLKGQKIPKKIIFL